MIIYEQYFKARFEEDNEIKDSVCARLILLQEEDELIYKVTLHFFKKEHEDLSLFQSDRNYEKEIYRGKGQRIGAREDAFLNAYIIHANQICDMIGVSIYFNQPISEAVYH